ncbi:pilus assembly protein TadG-related protein [Streptomyces sp. NPDC091268]|uniref:pilus assembly protein TadG-related protein n=1 Tax=Streptomyces sp. NPDC091268 TaxID=3365979 RepID=UPI00381EC5B4
MGDEGRGRMQVRRGRMRARRGQDRGQAFPVYVVAVAGLLFAALAFFAVGQASVTRSDAQGAADAGALAAAREARDHLLPGVVLADLQPKDWEDVVRGKLFDVTGACGAARAFAQKNDARATCDRAGLSFTVTVETNGTVGDSVIPGTGSMHGTADATAVIEPRCRLEQPSAPGGASPPADGGEPKPGPVTIVCEGGKGITFDPSEPDPWRTLGRKLFDVHLTA